MQNPNTKSKETHVQYYISETLTKVIPTQAQRLHLESGVFLTLFGGSYPKRTPQQVSKTVFTG